MVFGFRLYKLPLSSLQRRDSISRSVSYRETGPLNDVRNFWFLVIKILVPLNKEPLLFLLSPPFPSYYLILSSFFLYSTTLTFFFFFVPFYSVWTRLVFKYGPS